MADIFLTFDYELYFGATTGTVERCMIDPTRQLLEISKRTGVKYCFFYDIGFYLKLEEYAEKYPVLKNDIDKLKRQANQIVEQGHEIQLHIHPHWEDCTFDGNSWTIDTRRYKLNDFTDEASSEIIQRYYDKTTELASGKKPVAFRAGGWCIQPFSKIKLKLNEIGIKIDSSVFEGGYYEQGNYYYDFRNSPKKTFWKFENDPVKEEANGSFFEIPISSDVVSPIHFWKLFFLGRWNPAFHKPIGDGKAMNAPGQRKAILTTFTRNTVNMDGYNASLLNSQLSKHIHKKRGNEFVIIGHPKALSPFSLKTLEDFICKNQKQNRFIAFSEWLNKQND